VPGRLAQPEHPFRHLLASRRRTHVGCRDPKARRSPLDRCARAHPYVCGDFGSGRRPSCPSCCRPSRPVATAAVTTSGCRTAGARAPAGRGAPSVSVPSCRRLLGICCRVHASSTRQEQAARRPGNRRAPAAVVGPASVSRAVRDGSTRRPGRRRATGPCALPQSVQDEAHAACTVRRRAGPLQ